MEETGRSSRTKKRRGWDYSLTDFLWWKAPLKKKELMMVDGTENAPFSPLSILVLLC